MQSRYLNVVALHCAMEGRKGIRCLSDPAVRRQVYLKGVSSSMAALYTFEPEFFSLCASSQNTACHGTSRMLLSAPSCPCVKDLTV